MNNSAVRYRLRLSAMAFLVAGLLFVLYPAARPFSDEASLEGAAAFGSPAWLLAHIAAMVAFTLLVLGLWGLQRSLEGGPAGGTGYWALVLSLLGIGLALPFYGAEAYGLFAIGQAALKQQNAGLMELAAAVRSGTGLYLFLVGLLLLAAGAILTAVAVWRSGVYAQWSGLPYALGLGLFVPQFFWSQPLRVAHGVLVAAGCLWLAAGLWKQAKA